MIAKMIKDLVSVALIVALVLGMYFSGSGHYVLANTESEVPDHASRQEYVDAHNKARAEVGVGPLRWSGQLARDATLVGCYPLDDYDSNIPDLFGWKYGVNQLITTNEEFGKITLPPPRTVVESWVEEKKYYNHSANSCALDHQCDSYTQVVWRKSLELGCAMSMCEDGHGMAIVTLCFYNPPGNYKGQTPY